MPQLLACSIVIITVLVLLAGIVLAILILWLHITVAIGSLNSLLFYGNTLVAANKAVFLSYNRAAFSSVFISWLNLELGIDICYIDGMDIYIKTWIHLAFPIYIIFLVILLILTSRYSSKFSHLISKRNPVATLATLMLISYGKLFMSFCWLSHFLLLLRCILMDIEMFYGSLMAPLVTLLESMLLYLL